MDTTDPLDRLTILERAQLLHDATLRRHGDMLDRHEESLSRHEARMAELQGLAEEQMRNHARLTEIAASLATTLETIKDMLNRPNGH